jgi:putative DNA primase/helicase
VNDAEIVLIAEGLATGCSVFESTGFPTVVAFDAGNLAPVTAKIKAKCTDSKIIICADNDAYSQWSDHSGGNIGILKATEVARKSRCLVAIPEFVDKSTKPTDFNDLMILEGKERVKEIILQSTNNNSQDAGEIPEKFELTDAGLYYIESGKNVQKHRLSNYVKVVATATDENGIWGRMIEVKNIRGEFKQVFIPDCKFSGNCEPLRRELANLGLNLESTWKAKDLLSKYLTICTPQKHVVCVSKPGWHFGKIFATSEKVMGKFDSEIVCTADQSPFKKRGSVEDWQANIARYCQNNSRLILSVCAAFAATVLDICGFAGGGFHFTGQSSVGKTTCLKVAASVCGDKNYIKSCRATDNGLESIAACYNDALLILDEISQVDPNKIGDIAYMLANGFGKIRSSSLGSMQSTKTWRVLFLSSGETSLSTHMGLAGKKSQVGQDIRLLNINASPSSQSFGIFEDLHGFENGADLANFLIEKSARYYGAVILKFIENLVRNRESIAEYIDSKIREFKKIYLPQNASGQDVRTFEQFAFVGAVGEYATKNGLTGWPERTAIDGCMKCFNSWLEEKGGCGNIEKIKILEQVKLFFEQYAESRLLNIPNYSNQKIINMVGYRDENYYYITPESFKTVLCKGFEHKFATQTLKDNGWLITNSDGKTSVTRSINGANVRVYKLDKTAILS